MGPQVEALVNQSDEGTRLLKIDIDKWGSPVAEQYGIRAVPTLWLYEGTQRVDTDTRSVLGKLGG